MHYLKRGVVAVGALTMLATASSGTARSETLRLAVGFPEKSAAFYAHDRLAKNIEANSDLKVEVYPLSLLNLKEIPPGLRDGIADMGMVLMPYYPAEFAESNLAANLTMLSTTGKQIEVPGAAMGAAMMEYIFLHCPGCLSEYRQQNQVYLGTSTSHDFILNCTSPIHSVEDLEGKRFRTGAANFGRWAEYMGGVNVNVPANDIYEGLAQGVFDCAIVGATELSNLQIFDVVKNITTKIPGGIFAGVGTNNINRDTWKSLSAEQREVIFRASAQSAADMTWKYYVDAVRNLELAPEKGIEIAEPTPEMISKSEAFVEADIAVVAKAFSTDYGIEDVDAKIVTIRDLIEKYKALTEDVGDDPEALAQLYWDEIMSKVDLSTYGLN